MTLEITTTDIIQGGIPVAITLAGAMYAAVRLAIAAAVNRLHSDITERFMSKQSCHDVRMDCSETRKALREALAAQIKAARRPSETG